MARSASQMVRLLESRQTVLKMGILKTTFQMVSLMKRVTLRMEKRMENLSVITIMAN